MNPLHRIVSCFAAGALVVSLSGCGPRAAREAPDTLLLTIDTLRGDRWGCLGDPAARTPHLDRLSRGGTLAFEGRAPVPITLPSHTSMMTGLPPAVHGVRDNATFRLAPTAGTTLAEAMRDAGYRTAAFVSAFPLYPRFGLDRGFEHYDSALGTADVRVGGMRQRPAADTVDRVAGWLTALAAEPISTDASSGEPTRRAPLFLWVHFFDPHAPYEAPAPWNSVFPGDPYAAEVATADVESGRLLRKLREARAGRELCVAVVSDHGEGLNDHRESSHGTLIHAATIRVPIVARRDGYAPRLLASPLAVERIASTVLSMAGVEAELNPAAAPELHEPPTPVHAESLYGHLNFGWGGLRSREEDGWRLITGPVDRLYRMADDPGERRDLSKEHPEIVQRLKEALEDEWDERSRIAFAAEDVAVTEDDSEALRSLGYAGGGTAIDPADLETAFDGGEDPHVRMELVDRINRGLTLFDQGRVEAAIEELGAVARQDPGNRFVFQQLGAALLDAGRAEEARRALRSALDLPPNPDRVYLDLARAERMLGNPVAERAVLQEALAVYPESAEVRLKLSRPLVESGELESAAALLREALEIRPRSIPGHVHLAQVCTMQGKTDEARQLWRRVIDLDGGGVRSRQARRALRALDSGTGSR